MVISISVINNMILVNRIIPKGNLKKEKNLCLEAKNELVWFYPFSITLFVLSLKSKTTFYLSRKYILLYQHLIPYSQISKNSLALNSEFIMI